MKLGGIGIKGKHNIAHKNKKNVPYPPQSMPRWKDYHGYRQDYGKNCLRIKKKIRGQKKKRKR